MTTRREQQVREAPRSYRSTIRMGRAPRATSSLMTDVTPSRGSTSRDCMRSHRARKRYGLSPRKLLVSLTQLDTLGERGYLDHDLRGNRVDQADAIEGSLLVCHRR
jgi:hypothetical protein